jgi:hypothetical protein
MGSLKLLPFEENLLKSMIFWARFFFGDFFTPKKNKEKKKKLGKLINFPAKIHYLLGKNTC